MDNEKRLAARGVLYMLSNDKHANVLVCSIYSLRKAGFDGPVHIAAGDDKGEAVARRLAQEPRLAGWGGISWHRWQPPSGPRGSAYQAKTFMDGLTPFDETLFLDADTLVVGGLGPLFEFGPQDVILTQFADWKSNGRKIPGRIKPWASVAADDVQEMLARPYPAINTGVLSWRKGDGASAFFRDWQETTAKRVCFICDELAAQLIFWRHSVRVLDDRYNASPIHSERSRTGEAVVYHFHGRKHIKREQGRSIWLPWYDEVVRLNIAGIAEWTPAGDRELKAYLESAQRDGAGQPDDDEEESEPADEAVLAQE